MKIKAFTLSEVLLTLAIIGVITSITIPTLMTQNHARKYQTMTKKAIYILQASVDAKFEKKSATTRDMWDNGGFSFFEWLTDVGVNPDNHPEDAIMLVTHTMAGDDVDYGQTQDGMIYRAEITDRDDDYKHGAMVRFSVDLNGAEPPTQDTADEALGPGNEENEDIIWLRMDEYGTIRPLNHNGNNNAMRYFDLTNRGL